MADTPDAALIEAIAEAIYVSWDQATPWSALDADIDSGTRELFRHDARAAYAAVVEHLGLTEEARWFLPAERGEPRPPRLDKPQSRLVSKWEEVQS